SQDIPETEPTLDELRVKQLQNMDTHIFDAKDIKNFNAVLLAYASHDISHPPPGYVYWFYDGNRVTNAVEFRTFPLHDRVKEWAEQHGKEGKLWVEKVDHGPGAFTSF